MKSSLWLIVFNKFYRRCFTIVLLLVTAHTLTAAAAQILEQNLQLQSAHYSGQQLIEIIKKQANAQVSYDEAVNGRLGRIVSVRKKNATVKEVLGWLKADANITYNNQGNFIVLTAFQAGNAQDSKITGKVTDETGQPLPGVTIRVVELNRATVSNTEGNYTISASPGNYTVDASYISFETQHISSVKVKTGENTILNIGMKPSTKSLNEVMVTALGIKREEKSLGYSAQNVTSKSLEDAKTNNWVSSLSGKVAGLNIVSTGSGPVSSSRITLRGESSLNLDNNQALIVIDGIPVSNRITGTGYKAHLAADSPVDFGSDVSDINPDDIEKVTVLKGPAATALYGSRAAGGALIITTKSGQRNDKGLGITYNGNLSFDGVMKWPDYQFEYGEGRTDKYYSYGDSPDGVSTAAAAAQGRAFGPKFNGQLYYQYNPNSPDGKPTERTPWVAHKDYISKFFNTGITRTNNVSIEGGNENGSGRLSVTHLKNDWLVPNTGFERLSVALSANQKISDKLKISGKANYTNKSSDNLPLSGYNNQTIMYFMILGTTPNVDIDWFKPYWQPGQVNIQQRLPFNPGPDNVYLQTYEMLNKINKNGVIGNVMANYTFNPKLELMLRSGVDLSNEFRSQQRPYSMTKYPKGSYREQTVFNFESNTDILLSYKDKFSNKVKFSVSGGGNLMKQTYNFVGIYADQLAQPGVYQLSNSLDQAVADPNKSEKAINSLYAFGQLSYRDLAYLDVTGRNDWSSTLPYGNNSFFYPSVSSSFILSDIFSLPKAVSFAKFRFSWAQVGNDTRPYQTAKYYDKIYSNSFTNPGTLFNANLKPEITSSFETGLDMRFFQSRLGFDLALYTNNSRNQILAIPLDPISGYSSALLNAGLINSRGIELQVTGKPFNNPKFKWNSTINFSSNRSYVRELAQGITNQVIYNHDTNVSIEARVGGRMGDMYGRGFQRSPDGKIIYASTGVPAELDQTLKVFGNAFPDWKAGLQNEFTIKNFRVSFLIDGQKGGSVFSQTSHKLNTLGKTKVTLPGRDGGIVGDGVVLQPDGSYKPNTVNVPASKYYDEYYKITNAEVNIYDASYIKLREARIDFNLPAKMITKLHLKQVMLGVYGRNLLVITNFPAFDPEAANLNNGTITPGVEITQFPTERTIGLNLTLKL
jgi:TonB-linked SusC/RagA family outer membrane protein